MSKKAKQLAKASFEQSKKNADELKIVLREEPSKNLFNKNDVINGYYVRWVTGELGVNTDYSSSDYIMIKPNTSYVINIFDQIAFYDESQVYISGLDSTGQLGQEVTFTSPTNAAYIRVCMPTLNLDSYQLEEGMESTEYESAIIYKLSPSTKVMNVNIQSKSIETDKLVDADNFVMTISVVNLFDKDNVIDGKYTRWNSGQLVDNPSYISSNLIEIDPDNDYVINIFDQIAFYDESQVYISGLDSTGQLGQEVTFTSPTNAAYIRVCMPTLNLDIYKLEEGTISTSSAATLPPRIKVTDENLKVKAIGVDKLIDGDRVVLAIKSKNLFNKEAITSEKYVRWDIGNLGDNVNYSVSEYIPISPDTAYAVNFGDQIAFFDANKVYVSGINFNSTPNNSVTFFSPNNVYYVRLSIPNSKLLIAQLEEGTESTEYVGYDSMVIPSSYLEGMSFGGGIFKTIHSIIAPIRANNGFKIKLIGDSITHGVGGTGWQQNGEQIGSTSFYTSPDSYCWGNLLRDYLYEKFSCTVKNWGTTGRTSSFLLSNLSTLVEADDDVIICMIGTNDRNASNNTTKQEYYDNLIAIGNYVRGLDKEIIFMSSIPASIANETDVGNPKNYHMEDVDHIVMSVATYFDMEYISLYKNFMNYCDLKDITIDSLLADGLHPNDQGYGIMFNIVTDHLGIGRKRPGATW
ncbi:SGNH/GDSL hydrolase family protein [Bacillus sp. 03113]|uniref:SGNH/GDSL hydrolase family protein n=1 Tax=Bacillus sp. 03113 TaxID=2578211 RepID=UPI001144D8FF|nr:SGNH/GDSL hydrolase family protein [Bacillus sp. 03113]